MGDRHFSTIHFATTFVFGVGCFGSWQIVSGKIKRNHELKAKFLHSPATLTFGTSSKLCKAPSMPGFDGGYWGAKKTMFT